MQQPHEHRFEVGDKAVYPAQGVAEVVSIEEKDIAGSRQAFYVLRLLDTDRKILVPVQRAAKVGLRPPVSEAEIGKVYAILEQDSPPPDLQTWNRRYRGFMETLKAGSVLDIATLMRDLHRLAGEKELSFGERRMLETARNLVVREIAVARRRAAESVEADIEARLAR